MDKCTQCKQHIRLIREVQDALIRAGKDTVAGYTGRFAECIDEMAQEIRHLSEASTRLDEAWRCPMCGEIINELPCPNCGNAEASGG